MRTRALPFLFLAACDLDVTLAGDGEGAHSPLGRYELTQLTDDVHVDSAIASPDGERMALVGWTGPTYSTTDLYVADLDGSDRVRVAIDASAARFSPDGSRIAWLRGAHLYLSDLDGSDVVDVSGTVGPVGWYTFSPDGSRLVFSAAGGIYLGQASGADPSELAPAGSGYATPTFTPDGASVIAVAAGAGGVSLWLLDATGEGSTPISQGELAAAGPVTATPDGSRLLLDATPIGGRRGFYAMSPDGTGLEMLTVGPGIQGAFVPSPDASRVAFYVGLEEDFAWIEVLDLDTGRYTGVAASGADGQITPGGWLPGSDALLVVKPGPGDPYSRHAFLAREVPADTGN